MGVAAYGIIANLSLVVIAVYTGIAQGIQPILSKSHGKNDTLKIKRTLRYALITMLALSAVIYAIVLFGAIPITSIFNSDNNNLLQSIAENGLRLYFTACPFAGFNIIISIYFTSTEKPAPAHIISLLRGFIVIIPAAIVLSKLANMNGVWCAFPLTEFTVMIIILMYKIIKNKAYKPQL